MANKIVIVRARGPAGPGYEEAEAQANAAAASATAAAGSQLSASNDAAATAADRVQTSIDVAAASASASSAETDAATATTQAGIATTKAGEATTAAAQFVLTGNNLNPVANWADIPEAGNEVQNAQVQPLLDRFKYLESPGGGAKIGLTDAGNYYTDNTVEGALQEVGEAIKTGLGEKFSSVYSTANGGYPKGARLLKADSSGYWLSKIDANTTDPDSDSANWQTVGDANFEDASAVTSLDDSDLLIARRGSANVKITNENFAAPIIADANAAADRAETAADIAQNDAGIFPDTAKALSKGVVSLTGLTSGSGGTDGTFDLAFSGGGGSKAAGWFVVSGGAVTSYGMSYPGYDYTSAPTPDFSACADLTGASAAAVLAVNATDGQYFYVPDSDDSAVMQLWQNVSGTATDTGKRTPSTGFITDRVDRRAVSSPRIPLYVDPAGNVPVWLVNGDLAARGVNDSIVGLLNNRVVSKGTSIVSAGSQRGPLFADGDGNVVLWHERGLMSARGLSGSLMASIRAAIAAVTQARMMPAAAAIPIATDGRTLYKWRARRAKRLQSGVGVPRCIITGDSWTEYTAIPQRLADRLRVDLGGSGYGWISVNGTYMLDSVTLVKSGWTLYDVSAAGSAPSAPADGCGIDGQAIVATSTSATISVGSLQATNISIYYHDGDGTFRYRVDGGSWTSVAGGNSGARQKVAITGLTDTTHTLDIDTTGNAGGVRLYGFHASRAESGVEVLKAGNAGATALQMAAIVNDIEYHAADLAADMVVIVLGTNDYRLSNSVSSYKTGLLALIDAYRSADSDIGIILCAPAQCDASGATAETFFRDAAYEIAISEGVEFFNLYDLFADYSAMNGLGMWVDSLHLNNDGARYLTDAIVSQFDLGA